MKKIYLFTIFLILCFHEAESQCSTGGAAWLPGTTNGVMSATGIIAGINIVNARTVGTMTSGRPLYQVSSSTWKGLTFAALQVWRAYSLPGTNYTYFKLQVPMDSNSMHLRVDNIRGDFLNWETQRIKGYLNGVLVPIVFKDPVNGAYITGGNTINGASTTTSAVQSAMRAMFTTAVDSIVVQQVSSSDWIIAELMVECNFILPSTLSSFTATEAGNLVRLQWKNNLETVDLMYMDAERSDDGRTWSLVDRKHPGSLNYQYNTDDHIANERVNYYRIKYVFADGRETYSNILRINRAKNSAFSCTVFPNPSKDRLTVSFNTNVSRAIVYNSEGRIIRILGSSQGAQTVNTSSWNPGIYILVVETNDGQQISRKIFHQ